MFKLRFGWAIVLITLLCLGCSGSPSGGGTGGGGSEEPGGNDMPSAPGEMEVNSGDKEVILSWNEVSDDNLAGYNLYRAEESFSDISSMQPVNGTDLITSTEFTDSGLTNGTTYYYRLTAVDENDKESDASPEAKATPFSDPPERPKK